MNLRFDNPHLLGLTVLAVLPILIHLFARARPPAYRFSSVEFILRAVRNNARIKRPRDLLLMLLRFLGIGLLAAVFTRPVLYFGSGPAQRRTSLVIVVDATASMRCLDGAQTRFAQACAKTSDLIAQLRRGDQAAVVWLRHTPRSVFPTLAVNMDYLQRAVRRAQCSFEDGDIPAALQLGLDLLAEAPGGRRLCIISDFQKTAWERADLAVPEGINLLTLPVGRRERPNLAITRLTCRPGRPVRGETARISCEVRNYSSAPRTVTVHCSVRTRRQSDTVRLPPWGSTAAVFPWPVGTAGTTVVTASLEAPGDFAPDNRRRLRIESAPALRVGLVRTAAQFDSWRRVLEVLPGVRVRPVSAAGEGGDLDALVVPARGGAASGVLRKIVAAGTTVLWQPGRGLPSEAWKRLTGLSGGAAAVGKAVHPDSPAGLVVTVADAPPLRMLAKNGLAAFRAVRFREYVALPEQGVGERLLAFTDGAPALAHRRIGSGHLLVWNMPIGPDKSDFLTFPELLIPLVGECLAHYRTAGAFLKPSILPGERVRVPPRLRESVAVFSLTGPGGRTIPLSRSDGRKIEWTPPLRWPGVYTWRIGGEPAGRVVVNFPSIESDLRRLPVPPGGAHAGVIRSGSDYRLLEEGVPLWPRLYAAALLAFAVELILMVRYGWRRANVAGGSADRGGAA